MAGSVYHRLTCCILVACAAGAGGGCVTTAAHRHGAAPPDVPRELTKVVMPDYMVEPPDILLIDAVRVVPLPPYRIEPLDTLAIQVTESLPAQPIAGVYAVEPDGTVNLGFGYGSVKVVDMTLEEARKAIEDALRRVLKPGYQVTVAPSETRGKQQIAGAHLVRQDGKISLGTYGDVAVAGLTLAQVKQVIELHLSQYLQKPEVTVDVGGYNSKVYYVITDFAGSGEQVARLPLTGNETVLDGLSQVGGLSAASSKKRIWVARPVPAQACDQILPVDWIAITQRGQTVTNYQLMPGDRVYVHSQALVIADSALAKFFAPIERIFGAVLLGASTVQQVGGQNQGLGGF